MTTEAEEILAFWMEEVGPEGWYLQDEALDARIRDRFLPLWERARAGELDGWLTKPRTALALAILLDQFPRNMFRGDPRAFATDPKARRVAKYAIDRGHDARVEGDVRQFFYLPLMHSESVEDQERAVRLFKLGFGPGSSLDHARAHRAVIRRFGRFPFRNDALGRRSTQAEGEWLAHGGYAAAVAEVS